MTKVMSSSLTKNIIFFSKFLELNECGSDFDDIHQRWRFFLSWYTFWKPQNESVDESLTNERSGFGTAVKSLSGTDLRKKSPCNQTRKWIKCILSFGLELTIFGILMNVSFGIDQKKFFFRFFRISMNFNGFHSFWLMGLKLNVIAHWWPIYKPMEMAHWWSIWRGLNWTWVKIV